MDEFTAHIFAAMAQRERKPISSRTRDGLAALKIRSVAKKGSSVRLGSPTNGTEEQAAKATAGAKRKADAHTETVIGGICKWQAKEITTYMDSPTCSTARSRHRAARSDGRPPSQTHHRRRWGTV